MPKIVPFGDIGFRHYCPGCKESHVFAVHKPFANGAKWTFNGDVEKPTFAPSMKITIGWSNRPSTFTSCHYFLRDGMIQFLGDCTHALKGQTVECPEFREPDRGF